MKEPIFTVGRSHPTALMRTIDHGAALLQDNLFLIGAVNAAAAEHSLPAGCHAACRCKNVIQAVSLVHFRTFNGRLGTLTVKNQVIIANGTLAVLTHGEKAENGFKANTALCIAVYHPGRTVIIPEGAWINQSFPRQYAHRQIPLPQCIFRRNHEDAFIRHTIVDVESTIMVADGRCPHSLRMARHGIPRVRNIGQGIVHQRPIHQILGSKNGQTGHVVEGRSSQVISIPYPDHIRIRIVTHQHRIAVRAVTAVSTPEPIRHCCPSIHSSYSSQRSSA